MLTAQSEYNLVDQPVLLTISTYIKFDTLCSVEPAKHLRDQYPTTKMKVNCDGLKFQLKTVLGESVISQIISCGRSKRFPRKALSKNT